jgi:hypothetical protein
MEEIYLNKINAGDEQPVWSFGFCSKDIKTDIFLNYNYRYKRRCEDSFLERSLNIHAKYCLKCIMKSVRFL